MALVMLPCDLPWWPTITRHLTQITQSSGATELIECMQRIHAICNIGLDPDEPEEPDSTVFNGLRDFIERDMTDEERRLFFKVTLPRMAQRAIDLKRLRPPSGLRFILQQQVDRLELERDFVSALLANSFFSTFPKRTIKTHPTLQDFNFSNFFQHLHLSHQKCKLRSLLYYFEFLERNKETKKVALNRQVMSGAHWLTIEDWLHCKLPLCPLLIRRRGDVNSAGSDHLIVCSSNGRIGGDVLNDGNSSECVQLATCPELLAVLLCVEALEDNEVLVVEGVLQVSRISNPKIEPKLEILSYPRLVTICCMDPEDYSELPMLQLQQDSVLRELNKALLGFRQKPPTNGLIPRRLSPIGESFSSTPDNDLSNSKTERKSPERLIVNRRFIVLGSSGECLPVTRHPSKYNSCQSTNSPELDFHSARTSFTDEDPEETARKASCLQEERRSMFADRLKEALDRAEIATTESEESDQRNKRDGSCGFVLEGESQRDTYREQFRAFKSASSKYSFTTDYSSELELVYEQLGRWLDEDNSLPQDLDTKAIREKAVITFAGNLLKRTLSESFVGVAVDEGEPSEEIPEKNVKLAARSLSLELARHKNKLAAQLVSVVLNANEDLMPVATFNWGCSTRNGNPQLKLMIQWLAASVALLPHILYFTRENSELNKLDTVCRVLLDRQWSVGELVSAILKFCEKKLFHHTELLSSTSLFEQIIRMDEKHLAVHFEKISE